MAANKVNGPAIFPIIVSLVFVSGVTAVVSIAAHLIFKGTLPATVVSVLLSETLYVLFVLAYIFCMSAGLERAESFAWLPIWLPLPIFVGFPTALSVSYGTDRIVTDSGESNSDRSRDCARRLIDDDGGPSDTRARMDK
jgi:hypothetical protein